MIDTSLWKTAPFAHQVEDARAVVDRNFFGLLNEMGTGKSKSVIDAACELYRAGAIDTVVVLCPAQVKPVWLNKDFGEVHLHCWVNFHLQEFSARRPTLPGPSAALQFIVTSYEYVRQERHSLDLIAFLRGRKTLLVADESSAIKNHKAAQTRAALRIRKYAKRAVILNGTPISNNHLDLYSQMEFLSPTVLNVANYYVFRNRIAEMVDKGRYKVVGRWRNLDWLAKAIKPHVARRIKADCRDLPPKLYTQAEVPLTPTSWRIYSEMREQMVAWLSDAEVASTQHAVVKLVRLSQITSGYVGGVQDESGEEAPETREISDEKLAALEQWIAERVDEHLGDFRCIVWCRFRKEQERAFSRLSPKYRVYRIYGGQDRASREAAVEQFSNPLCNTKPETVILLGQQQAGGLGLNLTMANFVAYLSNDYSLMTRLQSEDRCHRVGQRANKVTYVDFIATGPKGQRTIDSVIYKALRRKEDLANLTTAEWRVQLVEDPPF